MAGQHIEIQSAIDINSIRIRSLGRDLRLFETPGRHRQKSNRWAPRAHSNRAFL